MFVRMVCVSTRLEDTAVNVLRATLHPAIRKAVLVSIVVRLDSVVYDNIIIKEFGYFSQEISLFLLHFRP